MNTRNILIVGFIALLGTTSYYWGKKQGAKEVELEARRASAHALLAAKNEFSLIQIIEGALRPENEEHREILVKTMIGTLEYYPILRKSLDFEPYGYPYSEEEMRWDKERIEGMIERLENSNVSITYMK